MCTSSWKFCRKSLLPSITLLGIPGVFPAYADWKTSIDVGYRPRTGAVASAGSIPPLTFTFKMHIFLDIPLNIRPDSLSGSGGGVESGLVVRAVFAKRFVFFSTAKMMKHTEKCHYRDTVSEISQCHGTLQNKSDRIRHSGLSENLFPFLNQKIASDWENKCCWMWK